MATLHHVAPSNDGSGAVGNVPHNADYLCLTASEEKYSGLIRALSLLLWWMHKGPYQLLTALLPAVVCASLV